jgi:PAS domain S-box-containing protein
MKKQARQNADDKYNQLLLTEMQRLARLGNWEFNPSTNRLTWSAEVARIFGLEAQVTQAGYEDFLAVVHPDDCAAVDAAYHTSVQTGQTEFEFEHRIVQSGSGEIRYVHEKCIHERDRQGVIVRSMGIVQDITARQAAVEALNESEARYRLLAENSTDMISRHDAQGYYLYVSPACLTLLGYAPEELVGRHAFEFVHPDDIQRVEQSRQGVIAQAVVSTTTFRSRRKTGEYVWLETISHTILDQATGEILGIHASSRDVSVRKQAEENLNKTRANMQAIIENTLDNIWAINTNYEILYTNDVFASAFQATFGVLLTPGVNILNSLPAAIRPTWKERYDRAFNGERFVFVDAIPLTGTPNMEPIVIHVEVAVNPIVHDGQVVGASFFGRDVTSRKQSQQALEVTLAKYKTLFDTFPLGISVTDETGRILETNTTAEKMLALPPDEQTQRNIDSSAWHIIRYDGAPMPPEEYASVRALAEKRLVENVRMGIVRADEATTWLNVTAAPLPVPGYGVVITYGDITAQKRGEESLHESEAKLSALFASMEEMVVLHEVVFDENGQPVNYRITDCNPAYTRITGIRREDAIGRLAHVVYGTDTPPYLEEFTRVGITGEPYHYETYFAPMGKHFSIWVVSPEKNQFATITVDITEIRKNQELITAKNKELELLHQVRTAIAQQMDLADIFRTTVESIGRTFGYTLVSLYLLEGDLRAGTGVLTLQHAVGYERIITQIPVSKGICGRVARTGQPVFIRDVRGDADFLEAVTGIVSEVCVPLIDQGRVVGILNIESRQGLTESDMRLMVALSENVSIAIGRARLYETARESEKKYRQISSLLRLMADTMPDMLWAKNIKQEYIFTNLAFCKKLLNAVDTEEPLGKTDLFFAQRERQAHPENPDWHTFGELCQNTDTITLQEMKPMQFDEYGNVQGEFLYLDVHKAPLYDDEGRVFGVVGTARDVTARRQTEAALRASEERYRSLFNRTLDGVYRSTRAGKFVDINPAIVQMFGYSSKEEMLGINIKTQMYFDPAERGSHILDTGGSGQETYRMRRKDGSEIWVEDHGYYLHDEQGNITFHEGILRDVTERRQAEMALQQDLLTAYNATLQGWSGALELREQETAGHSQRVVRLTVQLAQALGVAEEQLVHIQRGALLHDIGKMGIPDKILLKPSALTDEEWVIMRQHPLLAHRMLSGIAYLNPALDIPTYHHEKWDGTGYPYGLKGEEIPLAARIFSVVDAWDALQHDRPYHLALTEEATIEHLKKGAGSQFDPQVVKTFLEMIRRSGMEQPGNG